MNLASAIEGGLAGASALSLIEETLHKMDPKAPRPFLHKSGLIKRLKKSSGKKGSHSDKLYIELAGELLANAAYFGLSGLGKKKNAVLSGALLGATAGLGSAFLNHKDDSEKAGGQDSTAFSHREETKKKVLTVVLYTAGGMLAGLAIKKLKKSTLKKLSKKIKGKNK